MEQRDVNILDYFEILYRARKYIIGNFIIICLLAAGISLILPNYYKSKAVILPPSEGGDGFGFSEAMSMLPVNIRLGSQGSPSDVYIGIMKSQTVANGIINRFNLLEEYGAEDIDQARMTLKGLTDISLDREGLITISFEDKDPEQAAAIANTYVALLDSINQAVNRLGAAERADFIQDQIEENAVALKKAESELQEFQKQTNSISPYQQQRAAVTVTSELEMDILEKRTLLSEYRAKSFSDTHPLVRDLLNTIKVREELLEKMRFGNSGGDRESLFVPLQKTPEITMQYTKLMRRFEILSQLEQLLQQQYEEAKIQMANPTSTVSVLDKAQPPARKNRPKRKLIVLVAAAASLFFSIISVVTIEFVNRLTELDPANREKIKRLSRIMHIDA